SLGSDRRVLAIPAFISTLAAKPSRISSDMYCCNECGHRSITSKRCVAIKRRAWEGNMRSAVLVLSTAVASLGISTLVLAQDRSYSYDRAGNIIAIEVIDTRIDPTNCGSVGDRCAAGAKCVASVCVGPPSSTSTGQTQPTPVQLICATTHCGTPNHPKLVAGALRGHQVCGNFQGSSNWFFFNCPPLPSIENSGWQLTPLAIANPDGTTRANKAVILTLWAPSLAELLIAFENDAATLVAQEQVARQFGDAEVRVVGGNGQVAETLSDDGNMRTWVLQFMVPPCRSVTKLDIFNVGSSGTTN